jgi:zinc finger-like protein
LQVIFPALDNRVKNAANSYSLEHKGESNLFDQLFELLNSYTQNDESFPRELASCTGVLQTSLSQHMAKEEQQVRFRFCRLFTFRLHSSMRLLFIYEIWHVIDE